MTPAPPVLPIPVLRCPAATRAWPHVFCVINGKIIVRRWRP